MLLLRTLQQFDIDLLDFLTVLFSAGLLLFFLLAALLMPLLAVATESLYCLKRKIFYDKCALQISQGGFWLAFFLFLLIGCSIVALFAVEAPRYLKPPLVWGSAIFFTPFLLILALLGLYAISWENLKKLRGVHLPLGWLGAFFCLMVLHGGFLLLFSPHPDLGIQSLLLEPQGGFSLLLNNLVSSSPALWVGLALVLATGLAAGSGLAQMWLIFRRHKADYGRDYYAFAMRYCARIALVFSLLGALFTAGTLWQLWFSIPAHLHEAPDLGLLLLSFGLPLSSALLWLCIAKNKTPLRNKPAVFFACLFLITALGAQLSLFLNTFPVP